MPSIEKLQSGFIYKEDFSTDNIMWQFFPDDTTRYEKKNNNLVLKYGEGKVMALTKAPADNFVMQCKVKHRPLSANSSAGVILLKDTDDLVECESYWDIDAPKQVFYNYIKVVKVDLNYYFYSSINGSDWIVVGAVAYADCNLIGFFFTTDKADEEFAIEELVFYSSPMVTVSNTRTDIHVVEILKDYSVIKRQLVHEGDVEIDLTQMLLPLENVSLRLVTASLGIVQSIDLDSLSGGDQYGIYHNITLKLNGEVIDHNLPFDLGRLFGGTEVILTIENLEVDFTIMDLKVSIQRYSPYDIGHENVEILLEDHLEGAPYTKELVIPALRPTDPVNILMKVDRQSDVTTLFKARGFKYKIIIE